MSLAQALAAQAAKPGPPCSVGQMLAMMPDDERRTLLAALDKSLVRDDGKPYTLAAISDGLKAEGYPAVQAQTLGRHHKGKCSCGTR